jgi:endonuclease/exonuclease/phosphatase family metal-dependent hydrolase
LAALALLVRSWNVFHGNASPPERRDFLVEMVRLVADGADVVCLQELPVWALSRLGEWSGATAVGDVARRLRIPAQLSRRLTGLHHGLLRSAVTGQANAILLRPPLRVLWHGVLVLNPGRFRRAHARERRIGQAVRLSLPDGRTAVVANLHATSYRDRRLADAELMRAAVFAQSASEPDELLVLAGDFNVTAAESRALAELAAWGFSAPGTGIDHILVRGGELAEPLRVWPVERRTVGGRVLSDHAPVEVRIE